MQCQCSWPGPLKLSRGIDQESSSLDLEVDFGFKVGSAVDSRKVNCPTQDTDGVGTITCSVLIVTSHYQKTLQGYSWYLVYRLN